MKYTIAAAVLAASASACPGSKAFLTHAKCDMSVSFSNSCAAVSAEIQARVNSDTWTDPHNGGTYTLSEASDTKIAGQRVTGDGKYTDKFDFNLSGTGDSCSVEACSESQVNSVLDYSTNYCNLHSLYCSQGDGCTTIGADLTYTETYSSCSQHDDVCVAKKTEQISTELFDAMNGLLSVGEGDDEPCCNKCTVEGEEKYFSIDKLHDMCGECCMKPSDFAVYKIFEPGLTKAERDDICSSLSYPVYSETVTHGFGPIKMTLDLFNHEKDNYKVMGDACEAPNTECVFNDAGDTECCTQGEFCVKGIGCRC